MFARIKKNTNTNKRSVLVCHNVRVGHEIKQQTIKVFGHSADEILLHGWLQEARHWITEHGAQWLHQHKQLKK